MSCDLHFQIRSMTLSLDGLLDYNEKDNEECTFEVSCLFSCRYTPFMHVNELVIIFMQKLNLLSSFKNCSDWLFAISKMLFTHFLHVFISSMQLSLFAETFQEMIQYQMGSRILASLEVSSKKLQQIIV